MRLELAPSRLLAAAIVAAHAAAALCAYSVVPGAGGALLAFALVALGLAAAWSRALLLAAGSVRAMEIGAGEARFELRGARTLCAAVGSRRYVSRFLVTLPLGRPLRRTLLVTADMLPPEEFRRLRIWALWNRLPSESRGVAPKQLPA